MRQLIADRRGVTIVEFGIVAPVMVLFLIGALDIAHSLYLDAVLEGIVQKTARDSSLEANASTMQATVIDNKVRAQVFALVRNVQKIDFNRRFYRTFAQAQQAQAESWTDTDGDGTCNHGEPYQDTNGNGSWDADGGDAGQGGAKDKTVYTVTIRYRHLLPVWRLLGGSDVRTVEARTVLQNQPYGDQGSYTAPVVTRTCPA